MSDRLEDVGDGVTEVEVSGDVRVYVKPVFVKCDEMTFPMDIMEKYNGGRYCVQCSGCHGCR